mgnify:CR=1 FL=1
MKIYIAGRINGNPDYKAEFKETKAVLQEAGHTVLNPAELPEGMKPADYMRICFAMLESADVVLFQRGWEVSKGAKLEYDYARYIGKDVIAVDTLSRVDSYDILRAVASTEKSIRERRERHNG